MVIHGLTADSFCLPTMRRIREYRRQTTSAAMPSDTNKEG
jgi:hypothetical protein